MMRTKILFGLLLLLLLTGCNDYNKEVCEIISSIDEYSKVQITDDYCIIKTTDGNKEYSLDCNIMMLSKINIIMLVNSSKIEYSSIPNICKLSKTNILSLT